MMTYKVKFNIYQNGNIIKTDFMNCDVRGKDLDTMTLRKRLTNNIKTWQSAYNKDRLTGKAVFEVESFERIN